MDITQQGSAAHAHIMTHQQKLQSPGPRARSLAPAAFLPLQTRLAGSSCRTSPAHTTRRSTLMVVLHQIGSATGCRPHARCAARRNGRTLYSFWPPLGSDENPKSFLKALGAALETGRERKFDDACALMMLCGRAAFAMVFAEDAQAMRRLAIHQVKYLSMSQCDVSAVA